MPKKYDQSFDEALQFLDHALTEVSAPPVADLIHDEFEQLKGHLKFTFSEAVRSVPEVASDVLKLSASTTSELVQLGFAESRIALEALERDVRRNPWPYIAGVAAGALAVGVLLGHRTQEERESQGALWKN